ncbi:UDP glucuronosyltransferase 5 family, polypeptide G1 isoform X3 [Gadus morhua]|uniref:UDP-glucuronosyltransferase n=3 Tax=Gadus morhua TaxID=8049 RepID=A0A8C4ZNS0_GADMO|nr:UDP-glucuronosyltransferase 1-2-like isoform X3 [Gadus morhua]XP_030193705.1 UDP-glucuronosyltransferase 1-2-like isoform X3 [Gadus morhua]
MLGLHLILIVIFIVHGCSGGNILVVPVDGSHWINMEVILRELQSRGHQLTVLRSPNSWYIPEISSFYTTITVTSPEDQGEGFDPSLFSLLMQRSFEQNKMTPFWHFIEQLKDRAHTIHIFHSATLHFLSTILNDSIFLTRLKSTRFDLLLTDPAFPTGVILAQYLKLPMIYSVRWINAGEAHGELAPSPPSYIPAYNSLFSDNMNFLQRTFNLLLYLVSILIEEVFIMPVYSELLHRHFPPGADLRSMQHSADIWLMRVDFVFEFPRPTMPNMVYIGGFQCREAKPLPTELEAFMQSSGEHGVVVMSLGTLVSALPKEMTEVIAEAFSRLPQKVVWRYLGHRPSNLANNTLLLEWLPQNDLLGHPKTRVFVAHGGTNGLYEAIYHGVPVLGLPLLFDQFDNLIRLKGRGAARVVDASSVNVEDFVEALRDMLENPSYRDNIQRLSRLHHDKPLSPLDTAVFWIEYVIRNKGAAHLRSAGSSLPWYIYHSIDVVIFLLALGVAFLWVLIYACRLCHWSYRTKSKVE